MASSKKHKLLGTAAGATIRQFTFEQSGTGGTAYYYDVAKMLSTHNQRLYRQGMTYLVQVEQVFMENTDGTAPGSGQYNQINSLPNCWQVRKSWAKAFKMYRKQVSAIVKRSGSKAYKARFNDFRIGYEHGTNWNDYIGVPGQGVAATEPSAAVFAFGDGEYEKSYITDLLTDTRKTCDMFGVEDTGSEYGLLSMYNSEPGVIGPDPQAVVTPDAYMEWVTDDEPSGTVIQDWTEQGNEPPYNPDQLQVVATQNSISANGLMANATPWIEAPCGLLKIVTASDQSISNNWITIRVAPGNYKGVCAESMIAKVN